MPAVIVKRFVGGYTGTQRYSIRRHDNGTFRIYHDNPFEGTGQPYQNDDQALEGIFPDAKTAEKELSRRGLI
jgi:hypothetical protein